MSHCFNNLLILRKNHSFYLQHTKAGFTLIQLMITLLAVSVLTAAFSPVITKKIQSGMLGNSGGYSTSCSGNCETCLTTDRSACKTCKENTYVSSNHLTFKAGNETYNCTPCGNGTTDGNNTSGSCICEMGYCGKDCGSTCGKGCMTCDPDNCSRCITCKEGYYLIGTICKECPTNSCNTTTINNRSASCDKCKGTTNKIDGTCGCESGYHPENCICTKDTPTTPTVTCSSNKYYNGTCCDSLNCSNCTNTSCQAACGLTCTSTSCTGGRIWNGTSCVCPSGYVWDDESGECKQEGTSACKAGWFKRPNSIYGTYCAPCGLPTSTGENGCTSCSISEASSGNYGQCTWGGGSSSGG